MDEATNFDAGWVAKIFATLRTAIGTVIIGNDEAVRLSFVTLLCSGHSLYEGVPGLAKTLLVRTLAATLGIRFGRIQCTPDLMPGSIIGAPVLQLENGDFRFRRGPLFTDLLMVDEINRAPAKTQAALLEAMQERAATVDGTSYPLGEWFTVMATQNPIEQEGTYTLPEAELDRFLFKIRIDYPSAEEEVRMVTTHHASLTSPAIASIASAQELGHARATRLKATLARDEVLRYAARTGTRDPRPSCDRGRSLAPPPPCRIVRAAGAILRTGRTCGFRLSRKIFQAVN